MEASASLRDFCCAGSALPVDRAIRLDRLSLVPEQIGDIEQGLARAAIADPLASVAADLIVKRITNPQMRCSKARRGRRGVGVGKDETRVRRLGAALHIFQIADQHAFDRNNVEGIRSCRRHGDGDVGAEVGEECGRRQEKIRVRRDGHARRAQFEMAIDHRIEQLRAPPLQARRRGTHGNLA